MEKFKRFIENLDPHNNKWHRLFVIGFSMGVPTVVGIGTVYGILWLRHVIHGV